MLIQELRLVTESGAGQSFGERPNWLNVVRCVNYVTIGNLQENEQLVKRMAV
jgi:hypothetical protein